MRCILRQNFLSIDIKSGETEGKRLCLFVEIALFKGYHSAHTPKIYRSRWRHIKCIFVDCCEGKAIVFVVVSKRFMAQIEYREALIRNE